MELRRIIHKGGALVNECGSGDWCVSQSLCPHWLLTLVRHYKCYFVDL